MTVTGNSRKRALIAAVALAATATTALAGCSSSSSSDKGSGDPLQKPAADGDTVVVGSNNFAESILIGDIYGEALKAKGLKVSYKPNIGSRETTYGLMKNGSLTVLPEYNGALLAYLDAKAAPTTVETTQAAVTAKLDPKLTVLNPAPAQNKDAVVLNAATAKKYGLTSKSTIADLSSHASDLVMGASPEFQTRHQGLVGLKSDYGQTYKSFKALDAGGPLTVAALKANNIQAGDVFTTDPSIPKNKFVVLQDPKNLFGFENVVPLVYKSKLPQKGVDALNAVSAKLDTESLLTMDTKVQSQNADPLAVAKEWLSKAGLG
ncbi:ABC transporter substrate-binding protein [Streptomyces sp. 8L]|uniref:ABC transporter substrate-binding protein n=1 Tax=Streptomyces sp. 8L TaxID=2877242 RepID=UPI001CD683BB|nr:ABC transporter substrate-binding protein [Streptomyces sp. 8L]MCA1223905.1 ABC transporter substrate-binding protein [Streptomyces sp. 8L]